MNNKKTEKISIPMILIFVLLMTTFAFVQTEVFDLFKTSGETSLIEKQEHTWGELEDISAAKGMYLSLKNDSTIPNFIDKSVPQRNLKDFYSLRAYSGAPPFIPHPILRSKTLTGGSCLSCHKSGGYTPPFNAYAPIVPHPEKQNCRQCHNPISQASPFKETQWIKNKGKRGFAHLVGSPLVIPHRLHMRENCLSCHSGPSAVKEIRTTHPERVNCMQCHVERNTNKIWVRK